MNKTDVVATLKVPPTPVPGGIRQKTNKSMENYKLRCVEKKNAKWMGEMTVGKECGLRGLGQPL